MGAGIYYCGRPVICVHMSARPAAAAAAVAQEEAAAEEEYDYDYNDDPANDAACDEDFDVNFDPEYADHLVRMEEAEAWYAAMMMLESKKKLQSNKPRPAPQQQQHAPISHTSKRWWNPLKWLDDFIKLDQAQNDAQQRHVVKAYYRANHPPPGNPRGGGGRVLARAESSYGPHGPPLPSYFNEWWS